MPRKGRKKAVVESPSKPKIDRPSEAEESGALPSLEPQLVCDDREVERRTAAIKAICVVETENLLARLRLLRSYLSKEHLEIPALDFFHENLPNLSVIRNEKYQIFELQWTGNDSYLFGNQDDGKYGRDSIRYVPDTPAIGGPQFSANSVKTTILEAANLQIPDLNFNELSRNQTLGRREAFETPGATSNRLSFGMTPKTLRAPKNGEMLLSIHGSPLGVFKEENLAAIHESGDGSNEDAS